MPCFHVVYCLITTLFKNQSANSEVLIGGNGCGHA